MALGNYGLGAVKARIAGAGGSVEMTDGLSESAGLKIERVGDTAFYEPTADGQLQISQNPSTSHVITLPVAKTSNINNQLQIMAAIQRADPSLLKSNTLVITDTIRKTLITCRGVAFITETPLEWAQKAGFNEWKFVAEFVDRVSI